MSLLHFLFYIGSGGGLDVLTATTGGAQELRLIGGSHRISERLAEELGPGVVSLRAAVRALSQDTESVTVAHDGGELTARRVIVALPPTLAGRLRFAPPLPAERDGLTQQIPMGTVIKVQAAYDAPFWRTDGLSGQVLSFEDPLEVTFDNSPADGSCGVLVGFLEASHGRAAARLDLSARRDLVLRCLTKYFGALAGEPTEYLERDWAAEEFTRGCYGGRLGAGVWTQYGAALVRPVGRIHWAGAETANEWNGYMDGAVRSGRRAASEVLAGL
jgi:monoamine oxidase